MKPSHYDPVNPGAGRLSRPGAAQLALIVLLVSSVAWLPALGQESPAPEAESAPAVATPTNPSPAAAKSEGSPKVRKSRKGHVEPGVAADQSGTNSVASTNEIEVSFQGANVDMIAQWLAKTTGKSVIKHPQVQCQLTIMSSKKMTPREAINLVYRALAMEGFSAIESQDSILLVPQDKEPRLNPEILDGKHKEIPEGRQRLVKIFPLAHIQAAELREKLRGVLSDKGSIDVDEPANQLVVTDYNDNLRLIAELIRDFDVPDSGLMVETYPLQYADADELGNMISLIMNSQPATSGSGGRPSSRNSSPSFPSGPMSFGGPPPSGESGGGNSSPPPSSSSSTGAGPQVRIWPDRTANRLVVFAPKSKLAEVRRLVEVLDTEKPEDVAVRVIPLKNVNATDLARDLAPLYQKMSGHSTKEMVEVAANDRANSLIVLSSEVNYKAVEKLIASLDTEEAQDKVVRTYVLKNADAEDVAKQLQDLNRDQDNSSSPFRFFYFGPSMNKSASRKMSVVADRRRNSLVVQAPPSQLDMVEKMIQELDEPVSDDSLAPRIFMLKYVSAVDIEDVLNELFLKKTQTRNYWDYYSDSSPETTDRDVGRLYGKVRITSEPYANAIIVTANSQESLGVIEDVLKQLDVPSDANESTLHIDLKFAKAATVANDINILFAKNGSPALRPANPQQQGNSPTYNNNPQQQQQQASTGSATTGFEMEKEDKEEGYYPWLGGQPDNPRTGDTRTQVRTVSDLVGRVRAVADERSNSLLISANVHYFPQILKLISELDAQTDQVLIEARLVEVSSDYLDKLGVRWAPSGSQQFTADDYDNSFLASGSATYTKGFGGNTTVNQPGIAAAQALTTLRSGVLASTINMDLLIQFLRRTTDAKVLAEPQVNIRDNQAGRLFVGQEVPIQTSASQQGSIGNYQNFAYKDVGVILEVTPHINSKGDVELKIHAESSTIVPGVTVLGGAVFDTRYFHTDLTAKNGETLVLGGIIQKQINDVVRKVPILGDLPGLGWAFKKRDKESQEVELMVFLRPKITKTVKDDRELLEDIYKKAPQIKDWQDGVDPKSGGKSKSGASKG